MMRNLAIELAPFGITVAARGTLVRLALRDPDQRTIDMRPRSLIEQMNDDQASAQIWNDVVNGRLRLLRPNLLK
jgi:hypothetical protein